MVSLTEAQCLSHYRFIYIIEDDVGAHMLQGSAQRIISFATCFESCRIDQLERSTRKCSTSSNSETDSVINCLKIEVSIDFQLL